MSGHLWEQRCPSPYPHLLWGPPMLWLPHSCSLSMQCFHLKGIKEIMSLENNPKGKLFLTWSQMWASMQPLNWAGHEQEVWEGKKEGSFHYNKMSRCNISQVLWLQFLWAHLKLQKQLERSSCVEGGLEGAPNGSKPQAQTLAAYPSHSAAACTPQRVGRGGRKAQPSSKGHNSFHPSFPNLVNLWRAEGEEEEGILILQSTKEVMKVWQCQSLTACHGNTGAASPFLLKPACSLCWGKQEPPQPDPPCLQPLQAGTGGVVEGDVMGDVSASRCWSVDTGWVRLNEILLRAGKTSKRRSGEVCLLSQFAHH